MSAKLNINLAVIKQMLDHSCKTKIVKLEIENGFVF